jgi:hypothetical protein
MAQAYMAQGMTGTAVFETFFRKLPEGRAYVLAAGVADVVEFLEALRFVEDDIAYLRGLGMFSEEFLARLAEVRFTGDVWAVPEGTAVFPHEPIVQVAAPIDEAQLVETYPREKVAKHGARDRRRIGRHPVAYDGMIGSEQHRLGRPGARQGRPLPRRELDGERLEPAEAPGGLGEPGLTGARLRCGIRLDRGVHARAPAQWAGGAWSRPPASRTTERAANTMPTYRAVMPR